MSPAPCRRRRTRTLSALAAAVIAAAAGAVAEAGAAPEDCPCAIVIQVDGLEPKDLDRERTPVLWALAHPDDREGQAATLGIANRRGYTWQAPRAGMAATPATATASLLTGAYADHTGVPADEFVEGSTDVRAVSADEAEAAQEGLEEDERPPFRGLSAADLRATTLIDALREDQEEPRDAAAFVGDPALAPIVSDAFDPDTGESEDFAVSWTPRATTGPEAGDPSLCPVPRDFGQRQADPTGTPGPPSVPGRDLPCPARDAQTLEEAGSGLSRAEAAGVALTFIHLAEIGRTKRGTLDLDCFDSEAGDACSESGTESPTAQAVAAAVQATDAALGRFLQRLATDPALSSTFGETTVVLAGTNGYEATPTARRVTGPDGSDLADYVQDLDPDARLVAQGTLGTIYHREPDPEVRRARVVALRTALLGADGLEEVLYAHPGAAPAGAAPDEVEPRAHPTWRRDPVDRRTGARTGAGGELVLVAAPGRALGRAVPDPGGSVPNTPGDDPVDGDPRREVTNPYPASPGGPRNRAIAVIVNGPEDTVRQFPVGEAGGRHPVTREPDRLDDTNREDDQVTADVAAANAAPGDDADDVGHELQPETVDIAPTIAALLEIGLEGRQLGGRFLQEAFAVPLGLPVDDEPVEGAPEGAEELEVSGDPLPAERQVVVLPAPPAPATAPASTPRGSRFRGLVRALRAQVVDARGRPPSQAPRGALLNRIRLSGEIGRPRARVALTFYRRAASAPGGAQGRARGARRGGARARQRLRAIARFRSLQVGRGRIVLTLRVPPRYRPTHVGVAVTEVPAPRGRPARRGGAIVGVRGGALLHRRAGARRAGSGARLEHRRGGRGPAVLR